MQLNFVEQATFVHISSDFSLVKLNDLESTTGKTIRTGASLSLFFYKGVQITQSYEAILRRLYRNNELTPAALP